MVHKMQIILALIFGYVLLMPPFSSGQIAKNEGGTTINSKPPGAIVYIEGDYTIVGRTPCQIPKNLVGIYKLKAFKNGYENWSSTVSLLGNQQESIMIRLSPKTHFKAGIRSLIFPGWGQTYSDRKTMGVILGLAQLGTTISTLIAHFNYQDTVDDYNRAVKTFEQKKKIYEERERYWKIVQDKDKKVDDAYNLRKRWIWISAGVWLYNLLDAIIFFPSYGKELYNLNTPMMSGSIQDGRLTLSITKSF